MVGISRVLSAAVLLVSGSKASGPEPHLEGVADEPGLDESGQETSDSSAAATTSRYKWVANLALCPDSSFTPRPFPIDTKADTLTKLMADRAAGSNALDAVIAQSINAAYTNGQAAVTRSLENIKTGDDDQEFTTSMKTAFKQINDLIELYKSEMSQDPSDPQNPSIEGTTHTDTTAVQGTPQGPPTGATSLAGNQPHLTTTPTGTTSSGGIPHAPPTGATSQGEHQAHSTTTPTGAIGGEGIPHAPLLGPTPQAGHQPHLPTDSVIVVKTPDAPLLGPTPQSGQQLTPPTPSSEGAPKPTTLTTPPVSPIPTPPTGSTPTPPTSPSPLGQPHPSAFIEISEISWPWSKKTEGEAAPPPPATTAEKVVHLQMDEISKSIKQLEKLQGQILTLSRTEGLVDIISRAIYYHAILPLRDAIKEALARRETSIKQLDVTLTDKHQEINKEVMAALHQSSGKAFANFEKQLAQTIAEDAHMMAKSAKHAAKSAKLIKLDRNYSEDVLYSTWLYTLASHWHKCSRTFEVLDHTGAAEEPIKTEKSPEELEAERKSFMKFATGVASSDGAFKSHNPFSHVEALIYVNLHYRFLPQLKTK